MMDWKTVATDGTQKKREQLYDEINKVRDETLRANLTHTYYKLFSFLDDDLATYDRKLKRIFK